MANKAQSYDNTEFTKIAGNFDNYKSDLTKEAKRIIIDTIHEKMKGCNTSYKPEFIYPMVYILDSISKVSVKNHMDYHSKTGYAITKSMVDRHYTVVKAVAIALLEAHKSGIQLFKKQIVGHDYMDKTQFNKLKGLFDDGKSVQEMIAFLQTQIQNED